MIKTQTLKGFRDFLPAEARKRQYVINTLKSVFELYGFEPLETPALEYEEILTGKYGDEGDQLMYRFEDNGQRRVAMRYDQTVPTARVAAQYASILPQPFKRYQIQPVWRAENTQKGRYREFVQCDIDTIGIDSPFADAEIIATTIAAYEKLGFKNFKILINDRYVFSELGKLVRDKFPNDLSNQLDMFLSIPMALDKLKKFGREKVIKELVDDKFTTEQAEYILDIVDRQKPTDRLKKIFEALEQLGVDQSIIEFSPTLARGLNYYTGVILEIESPDYPVGSLCGGGRYDELIGMFADRQIPAVGVAFGFDRTIEAMDTLGLFPENIVNSSTKVLVTIFSEEMKDKSLELCSRLRSNNINTEIYLGEIKDKNPLEKQLKYADAKKIPYVLILGPQEVEKNIITLRDMLTREQQEGNIEEIIKTLAK